MKPNQRFGLAIILATLVVMVATAFFLFDYQRDNRDRMARAQGLDLVRLLGGMGWHELVPRDGYRGFLEILARGQGNPDFAYGAMVGLDGEIVSEVTRPGVIVPHINISDEPSGWLGQRLLQANIANRQFIESHAPVFDSGEHKGFVRLGYFEPEISLDYSQLPSLATMTLPIFLLVPLFYFMLRQQIKPLKKISESLDDLADKAGMQQVELQPSEALGDFMEQFSQYIEATQNRIEILHKEQEDLQMSSKLLVYKNNRVDAILQNFPDAILVIDEAGEVSYANGKIERLLGISHE